MNEMVDSMFDELMVTLLNGTPPLYQQLAVATLVFIAVRLWQHMRERRQRRQGLSKPYNVRLITVSYFVVMIALSMGSWQKIEHLFENYVLVAFSRLLG